MKRWLMSALAGMLLIPPATWAAAESPGTAKPNILLILADDMGYGDPGCYGGTWTPTPAMDSLAREGVRCTDGYVTAPVCAPSRCGLMTGAYNQRFGMQWNEDRSKYGVGSHPLLPQALKAAGYVTGHIGKWNVGADLAGCFDETCDTIDWEADYFPGADGRYFGVDDPVNHASSKRQGIWGPERPDEEYLTDRLGRHAVEFVEKHRRGDKPFFLYLAFNAVHSPYHAPKEVEARYAHLQPPLNYYAAMLAKLDENIGRVLAVLPENTLVALVSDNGPARMPVVVWPDGWPTGVISGSAGPLSGHKAQFLEGGIREPFILRWPGRIKPGSVYRQPVITMDLYPTFLAAAGAPVPAGAKLDGVNLLPHLTGAREEVPHDILFWKSGDQGAVRKGDWKLVISAWKPKLQLFNLTDDIGEKRDLADQKPDLVAGLQKAWTDWSAAMPPRANPPVAKTGPGGAAAGGKPPQDRAAIFAAKDANGDGALSREEFLAGQTDAASAATRFEKWDTNRNGSLSREEFVTMGAGSK